jgi:hypothetical protein
MDTNRKGQPRDPHDPAIALVTALGHETDGRLVHDPREHRYWLDSREIVGVNRVLRCCGLVDDSFWGEEYAQRGKIVHDATVLIDRDDLGNIDPRLVPYCRGYERFLLRERPTFTAAEQFVYSERLLLAGRLDRRFAKLSGRKRRGILEIKTGRPGPIWHRWQLSGYAIADEHEIATDRAIVYIYPTSDTDGDYTLIECDNWIGDRNTFLHAHALVMERMRHGDRTIFENRKIERYTIGANERADRGTGRLATSGAADHQPEHVIVPASEGDRVHGLGAEIVDFQSATARRRARDRRSVENRKGGVRR